jgi:hypothetical protein
MAIFAVLFLYGALLLQNTSPIRDLVRCRRGKIMGGDWKYFGQHYMDFLKKSTIAGLA